MTAEDGSLTGATIDWLEFQDPDHDDERWRIPLSFFVSNWKCLFGQGCPGHVPQGSKFTYPDVGCCSIGTLIPDKADIDKLHERVKELTPADWDDDRRAYAEKNGYTKIGGPKELDTDDEGNDIPDSWFHPINTKVYKRACVFSNRANGSAGKPGCAFVALGQRTGRGHEETMPPACWQLPVGKKYEFDDDGNMTNVLIPWDRHYFGGEDEEGKHDHWMQWWCVDAPDAYVNDKPLYLEIERELRVMMGDKAYELMESLIKERANNHIAPMPGEVRNGGRPLLPMIVEGLTPKNGPCNFH